MASDDESIVNHVYSKMEVIPLVLYEESKSLDKQETQIDVSGERNRHVFNRGQPFYIPGVKYIVSIPYSGDAGLWKCQPSSFNFDPPYAHIVPNRNDEYNGQIEIIVERPMDKVGDGSEIGREIESTLANIRGYLQNIRGDVEGHNAELRKTILHHVKNRKQRTGVQDSVAKALGIPLKKKTGAPDLTSVEIKRRTIKPLPTKPKQPPEPTISDEDYEYILKVIRHEGRTFETTPQTYAIHDEEGLRDIMIAHLNGHYQGGATGETFRKSGKTDIRIEDKNRSAFVGECKVWNGAKEISGALDQLLGYLTWRDCKAALIIFNKTVAGFSNVQKQIPTTLSAHANHVSPCKNDEAGEWRFKFRSASDPDRLITVHVFLFDLYVASVKRGKS